MHPFGNVPLEARLEDIDGVDDAEVDLEAVGHVIVGDLAHDRAEVECAGCDLWIGREGHVGGGFAP